MRLTDRSFSLLLAMVPGMGGKSVMKVLARNQLLGRTAEEFLVLSSEAYREEYRLSQKASEYLVAHRESLVQESQPFEEKLEKLGVRWSVVTDAGFPEKIERFDSQGPAMVFMYGNMKLLGGKSFCVLSSRNASFDQLNEIEALTEEGVLRGEILVTGHDRPEYQRSAIVPLRWGAPRILCLDRGLFQVLGEDLRNEAFRAARLWRYEFDPHTDLVVSPFRPEAGFIGVNNQVRDRLVSSLSDSLYFVKVSPGGNMDKIATAAEKAGRNVIRS